MNDTRHVKIIDSTSNPAPLGLLGFGLTTILLNFANAGIIPLTGMIVAMGIFIGGIAQLIAGIMEWKKNNTFGTVASIAYGSFWIALTAIWTMPRLGLAEPADAASMGWFLTIWGIFSLGMLIGTFRINRILQFVFASLVILFALLAASDFTGSHTIKLIAGYEGIICGFSALYASLGNILNELYGKTLFLLEP
jgi:succinate-acetate transporter protein